jgi:hypothetical protein
MVAFLLRLISSGRLSSYIYRMDRSLRKNQPGENLNFAPLQSKR